MSNIKKIEDAEKSFYTADDLSRILELSMEATSVFCARAVMRKQLIRVKRGVYMLSDFVKRLGREDFFAIANFLQTPSYVSLLTALSYYEISTQYPIAKYESVNFVRTIDYESEGVIFEYFQTAKKHYFGFKMERDFFIAEPEKALIDAAHLTAFGKYALDLSSIDFTKFDFDKMAEYLSSYPTRTKNLLYRWRKSYERV